MQYSDYQRLGFSQQPASYEPDDPDHFALTHQQHMHHLHQSGDMIHPRGIHPMHYQHHYYGQQQLPYDTANPSAPYLYGPQPAPSFASERYYHSNQYLHPSSSPAFPQQQYHHHPNRPPHHYQLSLMIPHPTQNIPIYHHPPPSPPLEYIRRNQQQQQQRQSQPQMHRYRPPLSSSSMSTSGSSSLSSMSAPRMTHRSSARHRPYVSPTRGDNVSSTSTVSRVAPAPPPPRPFPGAQHFPSNRKVTKIPRNDYSQNYINTGQRPQNYILSASPRTRFAEHPKLRTLIELKQALFAARATPPMKIIPMHHEDIRTTPLPSLTCLTKFDVIYLSPPLLMNPRRPTTSNVVPWSWDNIGRLAVPAVASNPGFIFLWAGDGGENLERGRECLARWGYRRAEDIVWVKTNKDRGANDLGGDDEGLGVLRHHKEHCLVGIRGTLRRSKDTHFIHCNVDTDVIVAEISERKPAELYDIIERFCLGRRRLRLFGDALDATRPGWVTVLQDEVDGDGADAEILSTVMNFDPGLYRSWFEAGNGGVVGFDGRIEALRPKSPVR